MADYAIRVESLGKRYRIGGGTPLTLRDQIVSIFRRGWVRHQEEFWALKDLSFDVREGEVVGVIGRNGAGKSTLLKLISRITFPTEGRIEIRGRVALLLEVGTGFHPELTGRENIMLNGTILGMSRQEVRSRMEEVIEFSGVRKFIDTPVKHYSSGMYVRLAFAVAAHLEADVLLVDEVLAVGDSEFQAKCLGKMRDVARAGRTVVMVSHDTGALRRLCSRGIVLDQGRLVAEGNLEDCLEAYSHVRAAYVSQDLRSRTDREGTGEVIFTQVEFRSNGKPRTVFKAGDELEFIFHLEKRTDEVNRRVLVWFQVMKDEEVVFTGNSELYGNIELSKPHHCVRCTIPRLPLFAGRYFLRVFVMVDGRRSDYVEHAAEFLVDEGSFFPTGKTPREKVGVLVDQVWEVD